MFTIDRLGACTRLCETFPALITERLDGLKVARNSLVAQPRTSQDTAYRKSKYSYGLCNIEGTHRLQSIGHCNVASWLLSHNLDSLYPSSVEFYDRTYIELRKKGRRTVSFSSSISSFPMHFCHHLLLLLLLLPPTRAFSNKNTPTRWKPISWSFSAVKAKRALITERGATAELGDSKFQLWAFRWGEKRDGKEQRPGLSRMFGNVSYPKMNHPYRGKKRCPEKLECTLQFFIRTLYMVIVTQTFKRHVCTYKMKKYNTT